METKTIPLKFKILATMFILGMLLLMGTMYFNQHILPPFGGQDMRWVLPVTLISLCPIILWAGSFLMILVEYDDFDIRHSINTVKRYVMEYHISKRNKTN